MIILFLLEQLKDFRDKWTMDCVEFLVEWMTNLWSLWIDIIRNNEGIITVSKPRVKFWPLQFRFKS